MPFPLIPVLAGAAAGMVAGSVGGKKGAQPQSQTVTQTNLPEYARPYFEGLLNRAGALTNLPYQRYVNKEGQPIGRIAGFTGEQQALQQEILGQQAPGEFGTASNLTQAAGLGSLQAAQFAPGQFRAQQIGMPNLQQFSMAGPQMVQGQQFGSPQMGAAQTGFSPQVQAFQMGAARDVGTQEVSAPTMEAARTSFGQGPLEQFRMEGPQAFGLAQAQQYMSPFLEQVLEPQLRSAVSDARRAQITQDLGAARQGTFGGSRQLLASMEREKDLSRQMGDIRARGMQSAFENAQQQFERDRAAGMTTGQQNLEAALRQQQLGTQTGLQSALANLSNEQQARVNNQAMQFQAQGMNQEQAMRAALANQGVDVTRRQQNLSAALQTQQLGAQTGLEALRANQQTDLERQRMREQSRQFSAQQGLAGLAQAGQMGQTLTNIGSARSQADLARFGQQTQTAAQQQALNQQKLDMAYQDFLRERDYPLEMLQQYSSLLRGVPVEVNSTQSTYAQQPGIAQQLLGVGLGGLGLYNTLRG